MSYNIRHGEGLDNVLDLSRSADVIKSQAPDLCGLQEVDQYCKRSDSIGQVLFLEEYTRMKGNFGKFMDYDGGSYGMATLSALPIISSEVISLPDAVYEPRSAIVNEIKANENCTIVFVNVHFDWIDGEDGVESRLNQAKALVSFIETKKHPVVITGDFNCTPDSPTMNYFYDHGFEFVNKGDDNLSFQGDHKVEIDHVIYRNTTKVKIRPKQCYLLDEPVVSDHRPLFAELEIVY